MRNTVFSSFMYLFILSVFFSSSTAKVEESHTASCDQEKILATIAEFHLTLAFGKSFPKSCLERIYVQKIDTLNGGQQGMFLRGRGGISHISLLSLLIVNGS